MIEAQKDKVLNVVLPVSLNNASATSAEVDTNGFAYIDYTLAVGATTGAISVCKIQESDTSGSGFADITGATLSAFPGATDDGKLYSIKIPLGGTRKRYQQIVLTEDNTGTGIYGVTARLSRANEVPNTAAERGLSGEVIL